MSSLFQACIIASNSEDCIENTIVSWKDVVGRFVVFLNNSNDSTESIIRKMIKDSWNIKLHTGEFINFKQARNKCLDLAGSKYTYVLSLDDSYEFRGNP